MMHTVAFSESQDAGGVLSLMAAVPDPSIRVTGDDLVVPPDVNKIIGAIACVGANATQAQLASPSLRRTQPYDIRPLVLGLVPTGFSPAYLHEGSPIPLDYNESLNARLNSNPAAAEQATIGVFLSDGVPAPVNGQIIKALFTVTSLVTAGQWVNAAITFPDLLPTGIYSVIGAELTGAGIVLARFYPVGGKWRPGFPVNQTLGDLQDEKFRNGALGKWFDFDQTQPPTIDLLASASAASATYTGTMDLLKVS